jgi:hypothetical protein
MNKLLLKLIYSSFVLASLSACTAVKPWERGNLALPQMALETDGHEAALRVHAFHSKEGSSGGYGGGGGGCGCN